MTAAPPLEAPAGPSERGGHAGRRARWLKHLSHVGAAAILVAAFGPMPSLLGLGPGGTELLQFLATLVFAERLFGAEIRDYVVAGGMTGVLIATLIDGLRHPYDHAGEKFALQFTAFVAGALAIRGMKAFESDKITEEMDQSTLHREAAAGIPIQDAVRTLPHLQAGVALLSERLAGSTLPAVLGLPATVDVLAELAHVRVVQAPSHVLTNLLFSASYLPFNRTVTVNVRSRTPRVVAHELLHALHHAAIMRAITRADLRTLLTLLEKHRTAQFIDDTIDRVDAFLKSTPDGELPPEIRWDGADLVFYFKLLDKAPMEALGSYFDGVGLGAAPRYLEKAAYYFALPFAVLAGMDRTNGIYQSFAGYLNTDYVDDMRARGLVTSLLEPRSF